MDWNAGSFIHNDVHQVHDYCTTFAPRRTEASERIVRQRVAAAIPHPYYWGLVMNLSPESPDELINLIPELDVRLSCPFVAAFLKKLDEGVLTSSSVHR